MERTGLKKDNLSEIQLDKAQRIELASCVGNNSEQSISKFENYLKDTKEDREEEAKRTNTYIRTKREIASGMYKEYNRSVINKVNIDDSQIMFLSTLTPSAILKLSINEIRAFAELDEVTDIQLYEEPYGDPPSVDDHKTAMHMNEINNYDLKGRGVNILMTDHNYVRSDLNNFSDIQTPNNIKNVIDEHNYQPYNLNVLPYNSSEHANMVARFIEIFAENACMYVTSLISSTNLQDMEWAIIHDDINIINASANYSTPSSYYTSQSVRWFDALARRHDLILIASAGNDISNNVSNVISPACGYNSIAVGAYQTNGNLDQDTMFNYRYNPTTGTTLPTYKPDVVIPNGGTSGAAPQLTGVVAMLMEYEPTLKTQPEAVKAIILASSHRKVISYSGDTQETIESGLTQKQGVGAVDAYHALRTVILNNYDTVTTPDDIDDFTHTITPQFDDDINVSISWMIDSDITGTSNFSNFTLGTVCDIDLDVSKNNTLIGSSTKQNAGKQMVYIKNAEQNQTYTVGLSSHSATSISPSKFGIAWSERGNTEISSVQIVGNTIVGQTLTAVSTGSDYTTISSNKLTYKWYRSSDNNEWSTIDNAESQTYVLTNEDYQHYIKCEVTPKAWTLIADNTKQCVAATQITS